MDYAGEIISVDAFEVLKKEKDSYLVDVRTMAEWAYSGTPSLTTMGKNVIKLSWMFYPEMKVNEKFSDEISKLIPDKNSKIFFLCKVGGRSLNAAREMTKNGYINCYNITGGFEAVDQQRNLFGWMPSGLPIEPHV